LPKLFASAIDDIHKGAKSLYNYRGIDYKKHKKAKKLIKKWAKQGGKDYLNPKKTKAIMVLDKSGKPTALRNRIIQLFDNASGIVSSGQQDFYTAMRQTVIDLGGSGARVVYPSGVTRRLDTVVRQNMLYNIKMASREYNKIIGDMLGCDGIEVSFSMNPRPFHRFMEGRQFCYGKSKKMMGIFFNGTDDTRDSESGKNVIESLDDYNCNHRETPIICGVSEPAYSQQELANLKAENEKQHKINGISKDGYGWSQVLRGLETEIRKCKDEINALKAFGNSQKQIDDLNKKIKAYRAKYNEICDVTGIKPDLKRMSVYY
jgi:hypothetical protein